jgi:hypothetical protein
MHRPILRTRAFGGVLKSYAMTAVPAVITACGAIMLIEMNYRRATQPEAGAHMRLFGLDLDTSTAWPWIAGLVLLVLGALALRASWRSVQAAWQRATEEARLAPAPPVARP